jgi:hypothetical protein
LLWLSWLWLRLCVTLQMLPALTRALWPDLRRTDARLLRPLRES